MRWSDEGVRRISSSPWTIRRCGRAVRCARRSVAEPRGWQAVPVSLDPLEDHLLDRLRELPAGDDGDSSQAEAIWRAQIGSRLCDFAARDLRDTGRSFYSIGSAGHESNAVVALALRPTDPALLHYR